MPIEMPKGLPFSVDTWTPKSDSKRHHFLTHAHRDHLSGISAHFLYPIYATKITKSIVLRNFKQADEAAFVEIEVGRKWVVNDFDGDFSVTAFDANHCPGAVMFLFEGEFGNILHTGDCRLTSDCLQSLPMKFITKKGKEIMCQLDYLFLDCTFGRCPLKIPSKQSAIQQVINCIWKHPNAPVVYLACDMLGQEEILVEVSRTFGSKIYVDETTNSECLHALSLVAPEIISQDVSSRFQVIEGFPRLNERASQKLGEARANLQPGPLFIRPSTQWYANNDQLATTQVEKLNLSEAMRDEFGIWHVCYSMHSTRDELEWALQLLQPKWVISTTPPCRAMELDYVKKHCFKTRISNDDPLWKLLKVGNAKSDLLSSSVVLESCSVTVSAVVEDSKISVTLEEKTRNLVEPRSSPNSITLFGRARLGISDLDLLQEKKFDVSNASVVAEEVSSRESLLLDNMSCSENLAEELDAKRNAHIYSFRNLKNAEPSVDNGKTVNVESVVTCIGSSSDGKIVSKEASSQENMILNNLSCLEKSAEEMDAKKNMHIASVQNLKKNELTVDNMNIVKVESEVSCVESSSNFNDSLKKLYRSMNVPVPRPLPSLVELMGASKRIKVGSTSSSPKRMKY